MAIMDKTNWRRALGEATPRSRLVRLATVGGVAIAIAAIWSGHRVVTVGDSWGSGGVLTTIFSSASPGELTRILLSFPDGTRRVLEKREGEWKIEGGNRWYAISPERAAGLFGTPGGGEPELDQGVLVRYQGSNPSNHEEVFGVTESRGVRARFYRDKRLEEDLIIGKRAGRGKTATYLRRAGEDAVYMIEADLRDNFAGSALSLWRDRRIVPHLSPDQIDGLEVVDERTGAYVRLSREAGRAGRDAWHATSPAGDGEADPARVALALRTLCELEAVDYPAANVAGAARWTIRAIRTEGGPTVELRLGDLSKESALMPCAVGGRQESCMIFQPFALLRDPAEFLLNPTKRVATATESPTTPS